MQFLGISLSKTSSGTFNRDLMEYSFNGDGTCLLNLSSDANMSHLNQRNQGIRISFDFATNTDLNSAPISNCSTRQPSIASGLEIPIIASSKKITCGSNKQLTPTNLPKINKELLTVQSRPNRSISNEDLIYANAMEMHSSGCSGDSHGSTLSAPEQQTITIQTPMTKYYSKSSEQSSFKNKLKISKYKKKKLKELQSKMKRTENDELNDASKDKMFLTVKDNLSKKSNSYLNIHNLIRRSTKRKKKDQPNEVK